MANPYIEPNPIEVLVKEICHALMADCYIAALEVALTLPDICSQAESGASKGSRSLYEVWYDEHIPCMPQMDRIDVSNPEPRIPDTLHMPNFDGKACYVLRCRLLHNGNVLIDDRYAEEGRKPRGIEVGEVSFDVGTACICSVVPEDKRNPIGNNPEDKRIVINLVYLCLVLAEAALACYQTSEHKERYEAVRVQITANGTDTRGLESRSVSEWINHFELSMYLA
ncbi:hypothetical protein Olsu_1189 [Olsenella uli DSM 7084]|uniref:Uncharacterized protein n=1 Tax=Olsenella uli (strain ATCC 49627 / DSM 7084 / CCUG 31166 / CIP 109912 / JCM 12494 / LMG 11480 / NCIMB 702895 / VPI D76D-27C) TaxID=633147 RepID=E1QVZ3_OLSUV|nr:hypothetical protein [Olsenella uli]ADK68296.1 hypothetical protein Olsu_1189 [Olsenella uli DSM 7084]